MTRVWSTGAADGFRVGTDERRQTALPWLVQWVGSEGARRKAQRNVQTTANKYAYGVFGGDEGAQRKTYKRGGQHVLIFSAAAKAHGENEQKQRPHDFDVSTAAKAHGGKHNETYNLLYGQRGFWKRTCQSRDCTLWLLL